MVHGSAASYELLLQGLSHGFLLLQSCGNNAAFDCDATPSIQGIFAADTEAQTTVSVQVQGPIDPYRFNMFMADLLAERGSDIKRMSGVLCVQVSTHWLPMCTLCTQTLLCVLFSRDCCAVSHSTQYNHEG